MGSRQLAILAGWRRAGHNRPRSHLAARQVSPPRMSMHLLLRALLVMASVLLAVPVLAVQALTPVALAAPAADEQACSRAYDPAPAPGTGGSFWARYREPLPPAEVYNPPGPKRVGLQAGHWLTEDVPSELRGLGPGTSAYGKDEWEVNLDLAQRTAALLQAAGVQADILPTTIPVEYKAHAFLAIHTNGDASGSL